MIHWIILYDKLKESQLDCFYEGGLITAIRKDTENIKTNRMTITGKKRRKKRTTTLLINAL